MKHSFIACLAFATLSITSCKKDKDESVALTKENIAGVYTVTAFNMTVAGQPTDMLSAQACDKDNTYTLESDGDCVYSDAGVKCNPADPDETTKWSLNSLAGVTMLNFDIYSLPIKSFNGSELVLSTTGIPGSAQAGGSVTMTLKKK